MINEVFLKSKITNFIAYTHTLLFKHKLYNEKIQQHLDTLGKQDINFITQHIISDIVPYQTNKMQYIKSVFEKTNIDISPLEKEEVNKLELYISCFIDLVSS